MTLCDPMDCSPPGSSVHGIPQAKILEWVAISFSRKSSWPRLWTIAGRFFTVWATRAALFTAVHSKYTSSLTFSPLRLWLLWEWEKPRVWEARRGLCGFPPVKGMLMEEHGGWSAGCVLHLTGGLWLNEGATQALNQHIRWCTRHPRARDRKVLHTVS